VILVAPLLKSSYTVRMINRQMPMLMMAHLLRRQNIGDEHLKVYELVETELIFAAQRGVQPKKLSFEVFEALISFNPEG